MKEIMHSTYAHTPVGPYSLAVKAGSLIFMSGQIAPAATGANLYEAQTRAILNTIQSILHSWQLTMDNILKATIFLTDMNQFSVVNDVYASFFPTTPPARSCVEVSSLPKDSKVEIEVIVTAE
ncbi:Rid family detoxifying hydrolase [bacterium]|nr:Rid family detoxifying hydrolase [bacterium]